MIDSNGNNITINQAAVARCRRPGVDGGLTKVGSGTLTLTAGNTYTGGTTLRGGELALASPGVLPPTGAISFAGGGRSRPSTRRTTPPASAKRPGNPTPSIPTAWR